jgi:hypothetical protein
LRVSRGSISLARDDDRAECIGMLISNIRDTTNDDSDLVLIFLVNCVKFYELFVWVKPYTLASCSESTSLKCRIR